MTLEQAIEHAEEVADEKLKNTEFIKNNPYGDKSKIQGCVECAAEHRQLAAWLRELQERRKAPEIITCGECEHFRQEPDGEMWCGVSKGHGIDKDFFCGDAERRTE